MLQMNGCLIINMIVKMIILGLIATHSGRSKFKSFPIEAMKFFQKKKWPWGGGLKLNKFCAQSQIKEAKIRKVLQMKNMSGNDSKIDHEINVF